MFHYNRLKAFLNLNNLPKTPKSNNPLPVQPQPLNSFSTTTDHKSSTISYLIKNCNLSLKDALKATKRLRFNSHQKPVPVISFFKNHGFSNTQILDLIHRDPGLFVSNPIKIILPKFQFLSSKGASNSDIIAAVCRSPRFLRPNLKKYIIPGFDLVRSLCPSDQKAINSVIAFPDSICDAHIKPNVILLLKFGVTTSTIYHLLRTMPLILIYHNLKKVVVDVMGLGFDPSTHIFGVTLLVKWGCTDPEWDNKIHCLKKWGLSQDAIFNAIRNNPMFMRQSEIKLNAVMSFWVKQLGWDPLVLVTAPDIFGFNLEKRLIPRASVVQYLLSKGLMKKDASLVKPFYLSDELFLKEYVNCFEEDASTLLRLYQGGCYLVLG